MKISTRVPLDQLRPPERDVREHRPEQAVASIAQSMGDPTVGQLQPVLAYPAGHDDLEAETQEDLRALIQDGHDVVVLDGETRRQAAKDELGWHDIWCWVWDSPPENATVAQLDANTERIDMTSFETVRAIVDHKEETGRTWTEVAKDVGYSASTLSGYASVVNGPDWLTEPLRDPDHQLDVGHAREIYRVMGDSVTEGFEEIGGLEEEAAQAKQRKLGENLVHWCHEYGWTVTETRKGVERKIQEIHDELEHGGGHQERQRQAESDAASQMHGAPVNQQEEPDECIICGNRATTKVAIDVCDQDRGMLTDQQAKGEPLMAPAEEQQDAQPAQIDAVAEQLGVDPEGLADLMAASGPAQGD